MSDALTYRKFHWMEMPALAALLAVAAVLRIVDIGAESLWFDEGYTAAFISMPFVKMLGFMPTHEPHPPLYFIVLKLWSYLGGTSEIALRLPSAIFGVLTVWVLWSLVREHWGGAAAFGAAALCATSGIAVWYSQEARMYSLMLLLAVFSMRHYLRFLSPALPLGKTDSVMLVAADAALSYTHNVGAFLLLAQWCFMCGWGAANRNAPLEIARFKKWFSSQCALLIVLVPWACLLLAQREYVQAGFWIPRPALGAVLDQVRYLLVFESEGISFRMLAPLAILCLATWAAMLRDARVVATLTCFAVPVLACYFYSLVYVPIMIPRVLLYVTIPLFMLIALTLQRGRGYWAGFRRIAGAVLITALIAVNLHCWYRERERASKDEFRRAADIAAGLPPGKTAIVFPNAGSQPAFDYYFHKIACHDGFLEVPLPICYLDVPWGSRNLEPPVTPDAVARLGAVLKGRNRALLVMSHVQGTDPHDMVKRYFDERWRFSKKIDLVEITILLYER